MDAIGAKHWKTVRYVLRYPEELHNIILERRIRNKFIEETKTAGRPQKFYIEQIKYVARVKTVKNQIKFLNLIKSKQSNQIKNWSCKLTFG